MSLSREELALALEYWTHLPYALQLEAVIDCAYRNGWNTATIVGEIRHWMTMISHREQIESWGASLYGRDPEISEKDGEFCMQIVESAWRSRT